MTYPQLRTLGMGRGAIDNAVKHRRLLRVHRGVYALGHLAPSRLGDWMGAVLACGADAHLSRRSAAWHWEIRKAQGPRIDVTAPNAHSRRGIDVHRAVLLADERTVKDGIPITSVARTLADLSRILDVEEIQRAVRRAMFLRIFNLGELLRQRPTPVLTEVLKDLRPAESPLEDAFLRLIARFVIKEPSDVQHYPGTKRVDFIWHAERLVVETDGSHHRNQSEWQRDLHTNNDLVLAGYRLLRFSYADVIHRPRQTAERLLQALSMSSIR